VSTPSSIPAVIDALVVSFTAALGEGNVFDGPGVTADNPDQYVIVGMSDPDSEVLDESASSQQGWAWLGHVARDEVVVVHCCAVAWNGDTDQKAARDAAFAVLKVVTDAIEDDPSYGVSGVLYVTGITSSHLRQVQDDNGALAVVSFDIEIHSRLQ
jgi:hypothetical protein